MSAVLQQTNPLVALSRAHAAVEELQGLDLTGLDDEALLAYWRELERLRRRLPSLDHALVREGAGRGLVESLSVRSMPQLLRGLLRLDPGEASARVRAAEAAGPRRALTGQPLPAIFPAVAAAQAQGLISERHARLIVQTVDKLPDAAQAEHGAEVEEQLVDYAGRFDPVQLDKLATRISAHLDPDGRLKDVDYRNQHRDLTVRQRVDGSAALSGELTAECAELLLLHLDALAAPKPAVDGVKDPRTAGQRRHDALLDTLHLNVRAQQLPSVAGVTATLVVTMTQDQYETGTGLARTSHGALVPTAEVFGWAAGDYRLMTVVLDKTKGITGYSSTARLFTETQRLARQAIDGGCTFPGCPTPAAWCQLDHSIDFALGGPTTISNAALTCRHHNNHAKQQGWTPIHTEGGRVGWKPPPWIDPEQKLRFNELHRPLIE
jgi:hypothetical protein